MMLRHSEYLVSGTDEGKYGERLRREVLGSCFHYCLDSFTLASSLAPPLLKGTPSDGRY
jgi:hypothetical protein